MSNPPIPVDKFHTLKSGLRLHYTEVGQVSTDLPTILCLHGGGPGASGYSNYKFNLPAFAAAGFHAIAPDMAGFGLSDKPDNIDYTSQLHVACMRELCDALGIKQYVPVGNSLGGSVALELYFADKASVPALILMAPGGLLDPATFWGSTEGGVALAKFAQTRPFSEAAFREVLKLLVHDQSVINDDIINERFPIASEQPPRVFTSVSIQPTWEWLADIHCPILCFWGAKDRFLPATQALTLLEQAPHTKAVISSRAGHWYMLELPDDFNREVTDFLSAELSAQATGNPTA
jgi:4,5:9,10-diseco-3-hydroxy-5,9,17-trioxoandrosta-1(10),2-diene-4-oate hydrolase